MGYRCPRLPLLLLCYYISTNKISIICIYVNLNINVDSPEGITLSLRRLESSPNGKTNSLQPHCYFMHYILIMMSIINKKESRYLLKILKNMTKHLSFKGGKPFWGFHQKRFLTTRKMRKNIKTEKRTHFAVTKGGETTYKEILGSFWALGTKYCSKIVETLSNDILYIIKRQELSYLNENIHIWANCRPNCGSRPRINVPAAVITRTNQIAGLNETGANSSSALPKYATTTIRR